MCCGGRIRFPERSRTNQVYFISFFAFYIFRHSNLFLRDFISPETLSFSLIFGGKLQFQSRQRFLFFLHYETAASLFFFCPRYFPAYFIIIIPFLLLFQPDRISHILRASKSVDWQIVWRSESSSDYFPTQKLWKRSVGSLSTSCFLAGNIYFLFFWGARKHAEKNGSWGKTLTSLEI